MLSPKMQEALNSQINAEYYSSYLYLSMAAFCDRIDLKGFSHWFRIQSQEEMIHVMKFFDYILDRDGQVTLTAIEAPPTSWPSALGVFEAALAHERHITNRIGKLVELANAEGDHPTHALLQWFVNEQIEEEASVDTIVKQLRMAGDAPVALLMIDRELGQRTLTPATE